MQHVQRCVQIELTRTIYRLLYCCSNKVNLLIILLLIIIVEFLMRNCI